MREWLSRCPVTDAEQVRKWRVLNVLLLSFAGVLVVNGTFSFLFNTLQQGLTNLVTLGLIAGLYLVNHRGQVTVATWGLVASAMAFVLASAIDPGQGLMSAVISPTAFVVPIAVAGVLISWRVVPAITLLASGVTIWLYLDGLPQLAGYRGPHYDDILAMVFGLVLVFVATAAASWLSSRLIFEALGDLRARNVELVLANRALAEQERFRSELEIARTIQRDLLPAHLPILPGLELAAECRPALETSGDSYDVLVGDDGILHLVVSDACGKSVPAALLIALSRNSLRAALLRTGSPAAALTETNRALTPDLRRHQFVAISCLALDPRTGRLRLANAGQVYPALARPGSLGAPATCTFLETTGPRLPAGLLAGLVYQETVLALEPGDLLVACSDGLIEALAGTGEPFGFERLAALLATAAAAGASAAATLAQVLDAVSAWADPAQPQDDITVVVVRRRP